MKLRIYTRPFELTAAIENHIRKRVNNALARMEPEHGEVLVTLEDINGPRGGEDKQCKLQFSVAGAGQFVITDTKSDMYHAIDSAAKRARHAVSRARARRQKVRTPRVRAADNTLESAPLNEDQSELAM